MCSLCYRFTLFSLVSRVIKPQAPSIRHIGSIYNRHWHPQEWKKGRELSCRRVGQSAIVRTSNLLSMANMACKPRLSSSTASGGPSTLHGTTRVKRVSIEGNIAVGKSTFVRMLQSANQDWQLVPEPVGKWQSIDGDGTKKTVSNLLQMMYQEPQRWSYTFQTYSCMSRLRAQLQPPPAELLSSEGTPVQVFERSIYSDRYIFALNMFELGCINSTEWAVYQEWHSFLVEQFGHQVELEGIIYLRAPPQKCMERLGCRGRIEEEGVQLDYLDKLHTQHEKWLIEKSTKLHFERLGQVPVLILDAGVEFEKDLEVQEKLITKVKTFFKML